MDDRGERGVRETEQLSLEELSGIRETCLPSPPRGMALLVYHRDGVSSHPLSAARPLLLGREPNGAAHDAEPVVIRDPSLSQNHARFRLVGDKVEVVDLRSRNGTWLLGRRVERAELAPGDEVRLSAVPVVVQAEAALWALSRPLSHERFRGALEDEVTRARHFGRSFALLMIRTEGKPARHVGAYHAQVSKLLRPVDRVAFYSPDTLEILLPEASLEEAQRIARLITGSGVERRAELVAGVAIYPETAADPESLIEEARKAVLTVEGGRVRTAPTATRRAERPARGVEDDIVSHSPAFQQRLAQVDRIARSHISVLIQGESGVGKEVLAQRLHDRSERRGGPCITINCAAIPQGLVESTLFGHERGSFTGATHQQKGLFEAADGGTLMLDEIGDLPKASQAALLRVLETKKIRRVGGVEEIDVDVRVIAATHRDLVTMCRQGEFREDLYHRLSGTVLTVPSLRERTEDIDGLTALFLRRANQDSRRSISGVEPQAMELLRQYSWPGNVRELRNAIEHAVALSLSDRITVEDLPERVRGYSAPPPPNPSAPPKPPSDPPPVAQASPPPPGPAPQPSSAFSAAPADGTGDLRDRVAQFEARLIIDALNACDGNQRDAAKRLGLPLRTLVHKISALGIKRAPYAGPQQPSRKRKRS